MVVAAFQIPFFRYFWFDWDKDRQVIRFKSFIRIPGVSFVTGKLVYIWSIRVLLVGVILVGFVIYSKQL